MILNLLMLTQLSMSCASGDSPTTLASVANTESGFDTLAIHDNTDGETYQPSNEDAASHLAHTLIVERGHSVDLGLMQINSANLSRLGLSIGDAFDACHSIAAGARILRDGYQQALRVSFSRYNTGSDVRGFANGYVRRVELASEHLPAINGGLGPTSDHVDAPKTVPIPAERSWDVWAQDDDNSAVVSMDSPAQPQPVVRASAAGPSATSSSSPHPPLVRVVMLQPTGNPELP